jgi:hypothetical protein
LHGRRLFIAERLDRRGQRRYETKVFKR